MEFAENLKAQREKAGLCQEELADKLDVSRQSVSKWETGESYPSMEHIFALTDILDCRLGDLAGEEFSDDVAPATGRDTAPATSHTTKPYQPTATQQKSDHARYNRTWFINALADATGEPHAKCIQLDEILESNLWFGKRQRAKVASLIVRLGYTEKRADEIISTASKILKSAFKDRLKHPFKY